MACRGAGHQSDCQALLIHRAGGASNTGGAVLRRFFDDAALAALTPRLRPDAPTKLGYYPLLRPGERFPIADPALAPRLEPRPADDALFLQVRWRSACCALTLTVLRAVLLRCLLRIPSISKWDGGLQRTFKTSSSSHSSPPAAYGPGMALLGGQSAQDALIDPCPEVWQGMARAPVAELRLGRPAAGPVGGHCRRGGARVWAAGGHGRLPAHQGTAPVQPPKVLPDRRHSAGKSLEALIPQPDVAGALCSARCCMPEIYHELLRFHQAKGRYL